MGILDIGRQILTVGYKMPGKSQDINKLLKDIINDGLYKVPVITKTSDTEVEIQPFIAMIKDITNELILRMETTQNVFMSISPAEPYLVIRLNWINKIDNYVDFVNVGESDLQDNDIILGIGQFTSGVVLSSIDQSNIILANTKVLGTAFSDDVEEKFSFTRLGTDTLKAEYSNGNVIIKAGGMIEADGKVYTVKQDITLISKKGYIVFDPDTLLFKIKDNTPVYDNVRGGYYIQENVRVTKYKSINSLVCDTTISFPIGFDYIQFPNKLDPNELGLPGVWQDTSDELNGAFIRFAGENAVGFGAGVQSDLTKRHYHYTVVLATGGGEIGSYESIVRSRTDGSYTYSLRGSSTNPTVGKTSTEGSTETRPRNYTVRKWTRIS